MGKVYRVRLIKGHDARPDQIVDGCLGNSFDNGKIQEYSRGEAIKKAKLFGGKIEGIEGSETDRELKFDNYRIDIKTIESASNYDLSIRILKDGWLQGGTIMKRGSSDMAILKFAISHLESK